MAQPTLIFDLDGTLVDTAPDLSRTLNHILHNIGRPTVGLDAVRNMVGEGARAMIDKGLEATGGNHFNTEKLDELYDQFLTHYAAHIHDESRLFDGAYKVLEHLYDQDYYLGICTNKPVSMSKKLIASLGLTERFRANLGGDSLPVRKPDPLHLIQTVLEAGGRCDNAIFIGDSETDFKTAKAANIPVILVDFGYSRTPVRSLGSNAVISHFRELPAAIDSINNAF